MTHLQIKDLHVNIEGNDVVKGINLDIKPGEIHAIMGPNGSGKSSMSFAVAGHPKYKVKQGNIMLDGMDITNADVDVRARQGLFLGFQYPFEVSGVNFSNFIRTASKKVSKDDMPVFEFKKAMDATASKLGIGHVADRGLNEGFSGGEKKRAEMLQLEMLKPKIAILDEIDSGLDIDALKLVAESINNHIKKGGSALIITHYSRILDYVKPDYVHVMVDGKIVMSGDHEMPGKLEEKGYSWANGGVL